MNQKIYDCVVIGAGASGLMAGIWALEKGASTLLLEGTAKPARKILISGGGRANVTNRLAGERHYLNRSGHAARNVLRSFPAAKTIQFFESLGLFLTEEEDGKMFPISQNARDLKDALLKALETRGGEVAVAKKVKHLLFQEGLFHITGDDFSYFSKTAILATGGLSYPETGSDGSGLELACAFGHTIVPTTPALTPLLTDDPLFKGLTGISAPVEAVFCSGGRELARAHGPILFTHVGFSGPVILDLSRHWIRAEGKERGIFINFLANEKPIGFASELQRITRDKPGALVKKFLETQLPGRLVRVILEKSGISEDVPFNQLSREKRLMLIDHLFRFPLPVSGFLGYDKAEVTAGGASLEEVDSSTLESKKQPGLFFAGEILDVDGPVGGFNFQWAWSSGFVAGQAAAKKAKQSH